MAKKSPAQEYGADSIKQLKGLEAVRHNTGMFLGSPTDGHALHHCIEEIVANSVDEHLAGHCDEIRVELLPEGWCSVTDNGRGIPVGLNKDAGIDALQLVMTTLSAGGKFDKDSYAKSAGLHGVGAAAVNAVSSSCIVEVHRDGGKWVQEYSEGVPRTKVEKRGKSSHHGTKVMWQRDLKIFSDVVEYDEKAVSSRLQELAFLNPGLLIHFVDARAAETKKEKFCYEGGIKDYLVEIVGRKRGSIPVLYFRDSRGQLEIAMTWTEKDYEDIRCYANNTRNIDGGTHMTGFKNGMTRLVSDYVKDHGLGKGLGEEGITGADVREGLIAVVSLKIPDISFSSQTKDKLVTPRAKTIVEELIADQVSFFFKENPSIAKKVAERAVISAKAREAARKARDNVKRKEFLDLASLPGKLADCQSKDASECEIFIVEGASAGGSAKEARKRRYQAILPLRGKVLNVERVGLDSLLENKELGTIITALGCGIEQTRTFYVDRLRYHKVILMTDADIDGAHIRTLLLTFLFRCMPRLIYYGYVYIATPPLFGARLKGTKNDLFFTTIEDLERFRASLSPTQLKSLHVSRYKGLGELNAEELWATAMDPETRTLKQVTVDDAVRAERMFSLFMGDDIENRRAYIEDNATYATLDM